MAMVSSAGVKKFQVFSAVKPPKWRWEEIDRKLPPSPLLFSQRKGKTKEHFGKKRHQFLFEDSSIRQILSRIVAYSTFRPFLPKGMALAELKRKFEELKVINEKQESRVRYHESKVQNIVVSYLISGRFFFFAISQTSSFKCNDWWVILTLSLLCAFIYFVLFLDAVTMLYRTQYQLDIICEELTKICDKILVAENQDDFGLSMEAGEDSGGFGFSFPFHKKMLMFVSFRIVGTKTYIFFTACALLAVTAVESYVCKYLLCN